MKRERQMLPFFISIMDGPDNSYPISQSAWKEMIYISALQHVPSLGEYYEEYHLTHWSLKTSFLALSHDRSTAHKIKLLLMWQVNVMIKDVGRRRWGPHTR